MNEQPEEKKIEGIELDSFKPKFSMKQTTSYIGRSASEILDPDDKIPFLWTSTISIPRPTRSTAFGFDIMKAVSLLSLNPKEKYYSLTQTAKDFLKGLEGECFVVSVSGSPLVGKSSFLNLFISYFLYYQNDILQTETGGAIPYQDVYTVGDGRRSTTEGIDMYCIKFGNKNLLIMDIEGDNDPSRKDTGVWIYTNLVSVAVGLSNIHLYNYTGLPQQSFMDYFTSVSKLAKGNKIHPDFNTQFFFMKRNHNFYEEQDLKEDTLEIEKYFQGHLSDIYTSNCVFLFKTPPTHIISLKDPESCIRIDGFVCEKCQQDQFFKKAKELFDRILSLMNETPCYSSGSHIVEQVEKILEINRRDLKYVPDLGHVAKIRLQKFRKVQNRIHQEILQVEPPILDRNLSQKIQSLISDHPGLSDMDILKSFDKSVTTVTMRIAQMEYLIPEISKFVEESLIDVTFTVLDNDEKELLMNTYCKPFESVTTDLIKSLKEYEAVADKLMDKLNMIKEDIHNNLKEYIKAVTQVKHQSTVAATQIASSAALGLVAREVGVQVLAGFLVGGGVVGAVLVVYTLVKAKQKLDKTKKKNDELINSKKVDGVNNIKEAEEAMQVVEEFVTNMIEELKEKNRTLKDVCGEEKSRNYTLIQKMEECIDNKIKGEEIKMDEVVKLIQSMKVAQNNLERFKQCI